MGYQRNELSYRAEIANSLSDMIEQAKTKA